MAGRRSDARPPCGRAAGPRVSRSHPFRSAAPRPRPRAPHSRACALFDRRRAADPPSTSLPRGPDGEEGASAPAIAVLLPRCADTCATSPGARERPSSRRPACRGSSGAVAPASVGSPTYRPHLRANVGMVEKAERRRDASGPSPSAADFRAESPKLREHRLRTREPGVSSVPWGRFRASGVGSPPLSDHPSTRSRSDPNGERGAAVFDTPAPSPPSTDSGSMSSGPVQRSLPARRRASGAPSTFRTAPALGASFSTTVRHLCTTSRTRDRM